MSARAAEAPVVDRAGPIVDGLREYAATRLSSQLIDERRCIPPSVMLDLAGLGLFGMQIEPRHGGLGLSHRDTFRVMQQLAAVDPNVMLLVGVHNAIGVSPLQRFLDGERRADVLSRVAAGRALATLAVSEPGAGSNVRAIETTACRVAGGGYVLNGSKCWISLGSWAGYVSVVAKLVHDDGRSLGAAGFVIEKGTPGFVPGDEALTLGMKGIPQNVLTLRDVLVPPDALLGNETDGLSVAQTGFTAGRTYVGAVSVGAMKRCLQIAIRYAQRRTVATGRLADNGLTHHRLAECVAATDAVDKLVTHIADSLDDRGTVPPELCLICKIASAELMWQVVDRSVQTLGGRGYLDTNVVGQFFRDYRLMRIFDGATETLAVYLGTTILKDEHAFLAMLTDSFGDDPAIELLRDALTTGGARSYTGGVRHVRAAVVAELACWTALAAATNTHRASDIDHHAAEWCEHKLAAKIREASETDARADLLPAPDALAEHIASYAASIGDVEQTLPGEARELDRLVRR